MDLQSLFGLPGSTDVAVLVIILAGILAYLLLLALGAWVSRHTWGGPARQVLRLGGLVIVIILTGAAVLRQIGGEPLSRLAGSVARVSLIAGVAWLAYGLVTLLTREVEVIVEREGEGTVSAEEREQQARTLARILRSSALFLISLVAGLMILDELGFDVGPILAGAGIAGLAVSFGAQSLVRDLIAGCFILVENQFAVGDSIQVGDVAGAVERMTLRATFVRDLGGTLHVIPNGEIRVLSNKSKDWARAVVNVGVAYEEDIEQALAVLREVGAEVAQDEQLGPLLLEPPMVTGIEGLGDSAVKVRMMVKVKPGRQWHVARALRLRILRATSKAGISLPYPQMTVHLTPGVLPDE